jgi:hypothetical protein
MRASKDLTHDFNLLAAVNNRLARFLLFSGTLSRFLLFSGTLSS